MMVTEMLLPFDYILPETLQAAVDSCFENGTMYCLRVQVYQGSLYLTDYRAIFFDRQYAPSRVLPLLSVLRRHKIPDVDLVIAPNDEPRIKVKVHKRHWTRTCERYPGRHRGQNKLPPPLFSSTTNRAHLDLPWLDFSFFMVMHARTRLCHTCACVRACVREARGFPNGPQPTLARPHCSACSPCPTLSPAATR